MEPGYRKEHEADYRVPVRFQGGTREYKDNKDIGVVPVRGGGGGGGGGGGP
jgi:hypothetical protein